jgi:hypothetical protein
MGFFRFVAFLLLVGLLAVVGVNIYNAGVTAGINSDIGHAIASGAAIPAGYVPSAYLGQPGGFGFGGFLIGLFFLFLFFGLLRAAFGMGRMGGHHGGGYSKWGGRHEYLDSWHRERHGETPETAAPDKA